MFVYPFRRITLVWMLRTARTCFKMGYGYSQSTTNTSSTEINTTVGTDNLGNLIFNYSDPIIVDDSEKNTKGYKVFAIKAGNAIEAILLPKSVY